MNTLQDTREAQQMWEYKFRTASREGINLSSGKHRSLATILDSIVNKVTSKPATSAGNLREDFQPV